MKLYVISKVTKSKTYLNVTADTRQGLRYRFGGDWFHIYDGYNYHVLEVYAESADTAVPNTAAGAVIGGLVGLLAGPLGLIVGAGLGGAIGNSSDTSEAQRVKTFNSSR